MFLLNSCLSLFSAATSLWHPFSRSYGVILPSSLTMLLPSALGFSPHPPVSVYGTGVMHAIAAFLGTRSARFATYVRSASRSRVPRTGLPVRPLPRLHRYFRSRPAHCACVPTVLMHDSTGISACCPSATPLGLALGPDLPRADQLYPGNLGYSAGRIPTFLSLLIPAFSLPDAPPLLTVRLRRRRECSPTSGPESAPWLRCRVSAPEIFGAGPLD